jgi:osmotically-inducible protein OsmY
MRLSLILLATVSFLLSGCAAPVMLFGGVAGAGVTLSKQKTVGSSVDDTNIWTKIKAAFLKHNKEIPGVMTDISVEVSEGRVLLTGTAASSEDRLAITKLVWEQNGVREVINEIKIENGKYGFKVYSKDVWITTKVKGKLLSNNKIRSLNYNIETIETVVYVLGIAGSEEELSEVINEAESVKDVSKVISYVRVKGEKISSEKETLDDSEIRTEPKKKSPKKEKAAEPEVISNDEDAHEIEIGEDVE